MGSGNFLSDAVDRPREIYYLGMLMNVLERIDEYLQLGGLFNPELANHHAVSKLIIDCRDLIKDLIKQIEDSDKMLFNQSQTIRKYQEDTVAKHPTVKCKVSEPYVERAPCGEFRWFVYNIQSGHIVASTYSEGMAEAILAGIKNDKFYIDNYGICEKYCSPEPMV